MMFAPKRTPPAADSTGPGRAAGSLPPARCRASSQGSRSQRADPPSLLRLERRCLDVEQSDGRGADEHQRVGDQAVRKSDSRRRGERGPRVQPVRRGTADRQRSVQPPLDWVERPVSVTGCSGTGQSVHEIRYPASYRWRREEALFHLGVRWRQHGRYRLRSAGDQSDGLQALRK